MFMNKNIFCHLHDFLAAKLSWVVGLYTTKCMEFSSTDIFGQNFIFMHRNLIFMHQNFIFMHEIPCHNIFMHKTFRRG